MADGEPPAFDPHVPGQPSGQSPPADPPATALTPDEGEPVLPPAPPAVPPPSVRRHAVYDAWKTQFATWPVHIGNGLAHLGKWLTQLGKWLGRLGRRLARLSAFRPSPLQTLAMLGALAAVSVLGALAFPGNAIGQACVVAFVPGLCIAIGILGTRWYGTQALNQHLAQAVRNAVNATLHLKRSVRYVDDRLSEAQCHLDSGNKDGALIEVVRAKTATELSLGAAEQASRQWESLADAGGQPAPSGFAGDEHQTRPRIAEGDNPRAAQRAAIGGSLAGSVARIEDQYTLIINRGSEHGALPEMVFAVMADGGDQILDPETGEVIGELPTEKLRVKVVDVQPKYSRAVTFRTFTPARFGRPAMTASGRMAASSFDSIDESITRMLETELAEPVPVREAIANAKPSKQSDAPVRPQVRVDVGDRVRQIP